MSEIFKTNAPQYWDKNISVVPVVPGTKQGIKGWNNYNNSLPKPETRDGWLERHAEHGIALSTGFEVVPGQFLIGLDIDNEDYVRVLERAFGATICGKKGQKGVTAFFRCSERLKKSSYPKSGDRILDVLAGGSMCVIPPSLHPNTGNPYEWVGQSVVDMDFMDLPVITKAEIDVFGAIINASEHIQIMTGSSTHDATLALTAKLVKATDDEDLMIRMVTAFFPVGYDGDTLKELPEMMRSAIKKGFNRCSLNIESYDSGSMGPIPLGYTNEHGYAFFNQLKRTLSVLSPPQLLSPGLLMDLAPAAFWLDIAPKMTAKGNPTGDFDPNPIADLLMRGCRQRGPFRPATVYGSGVYIEGDRVVQNLRGPVPQSETRTYVRFMDLPEYSGLPIDAAQVFGFFQDFTWSDPLLAEIAFGWATLAPICGALAWRPHIIVSGPPGTGKTTLLKGVYGLANPLGCYFEGGTTEAGIRQSLNADSRAVVIDEFEGDQQQSRIAAIIRLARSSSSAEAQIVKGSVEGKAISFRTRSMFALGAVYQIPLSAADQTRFIDLALEPHENDQSARTRILDGLRYIEQHLGAWPNLVIDQIDTILSTIKQFERLMPGVDMRHAQNMAALFGACHAVLDGPMDDEKVKSIVDQRMGLIQRLACAAEDRDPSRCLDTILSIKADREITVLQAVALVHRGIEGWDDRREVNARLATSGVKIMDEGIAIANSHPNLQKAFLGTVFASGGWARALARIPGAKTGDDCRTRFQSNNPTRYTLIPTDYLNLDDKISHEERF